MRRRFTLKLLTAAALLWCGAGLPAVALAATEVAGVRFDDAVTVAGRELQLNGAGVRTARIVFKVYAAGLYLTEKKTTVADVLAADGPRRVAITMLRDVGTDDFANTFMDALKANTDGTERGKILPQTMKFGAVFGHIQTLRKGDQMLLDWTPGEGTQCYLNGRKIGELMPDVAFYNAVLRIWLGDKPVDKALKAALLGAKK